MLPRQPFDQCYTRGEHRMMSQPNYYQPLVQQRQPEALLPDYGYGQDYGQYFSDSVAPRMVTVTPHTVISPDCEPIQAGSINSRRRRSDSESTHYSSSGATATKRSLVTWENMTDEERDDVQRLRRKEQAFKTAICEGFKKHGTCAYGDDCRFAHGENELRLPAQPRGKAHPKYKTQLCDKYSANGHCPYGPRCQFIHKLKKGFPLLDYEILLSQGKISPAREEEIVNDDNMSHRRFSYSNRSPKKNRGREHGRRLEFEDRSSMGRRDVPRDAGVYPKMQVINIERALQLGSDENQRYDGCGGHRDARRPLGASNIGNVDHRRHSNGGGAGGLSNKSSSLLSLVFRGSDEPLTHGDNMKLAQQPDLSLIPEENEDTAHDISGGLTKQKKTTQSQWQDAFLGKKMDAIKEDDKENNYATNDCSIDESSGITEAELLAQSCDDELLAQGLYDNKYPDVSLGVLKQQWKPMK